MVRAVTIQITVQSLGGDHSRVINQPVHWRSDRLMELVHYALWKRSYHPSEVEFLQTWRKKRDNATKRPRQRMVDERGERKYLRADVRKALYVAWRRNYNAEQAERVARPESFDFLYHYRNRAWYKIKSSQSPWLIWYDVDWFSAHVEEYKRNGTVSALQEALRTYTGDFLEGCKTKGEWVQARRSELSKLYAWANFEMARHCQPVNRLRHLSIAMSRDPGNEKFVRTCFVEAARRTREHLEVQYSKWLKRCEWHEVAPSVVCKSLYEGLLKTAGDSELDAAYALYNERYDNRMYVALKKWIRAHYTAEHTDRIMDAVTSTAQYMCGMPSDIDPANYLAAALAYDSSVFERACAQVHVYLDTFGADGTFAGHQKFQRAVIEIDTLVFELPVSNLATAVRDLLRYISMAGKEDKILDAERGKMILQMVRYIVDEAIKNAHSD